MLSWLFGGNKSIADIIVARDLPAGNTAAVVTIADPGDGFRIVIHKIIFSYTAAPTGGRLTITGGLITLDVDITNSGPGVLTLSWPIAKSTASVITLAAGGGVIAGKLNVIYSVERT